MNFDECNLFLCDTDVDLFALHSTRDMPERIVAGLLKDILMGSWWKWKLTLLCPLFPPKLSTPLAHSFSSPLFCLSILTLSEALPQQEEPNYRDIGPMLKT